VPSGTPSRRPFSLLRGASSGAASRLRKAAVPLVLVVGALVLGGCKAPTFGAFRGATTQGHAEFKLWVGLFIAGLVVAIIVWLLIFWSVAAYRRKSADEIPRQFHSNIPLEIVYTVIPVAIVAVIFYFTVVTENQIDAVAKHPAERVNVLAYRWGWQFSYQNGEGRSQGVVVQTAAEPHLLAQPATSSEYPQMVLPEGEPVRIILRSADVVHELYVPAFNFGRFALPGHTNVFDFTPTKTGVYRGQCAEYCGLYHSEMLFSVRVVTPSAFAKWISVQQASQAKQGAAS
jgi:cytochrome c oxidase subunit 2